jgi:DNA-binding SARP family transcriptional activator
MPAPRLSSSIAFYMLGDLHIEYGIKKREKKYFPRSTQALLGYLLINRNRYHDREVLADRLWGRLDAERARQCLNTTIWRLRTFIDGANPCREAECFQSKNGALRFNTECNYWLDIEVFERTINFTCKKRVDQLTLHEVNELEAALDLYRGDFLETIGHSWAIAEREHLRAIYVDGLALLAQYRVREKDFAAAIALGHKALRLESLREDVHRIVIEAYARSGRVGEALRHFAVCSKQLRHELAVKPANETILLRDSILRGVDLARGPLAGADRSGWEESNPSA